MHNVRPVRAPLMPQRPPLHLSLYATPMMNLIWSVFPTSRMTHNHISSEPRLPFLPRSLIPSLLPRLLAPAAAHAPAARRKQWRPRPCHSARPAAPRALHMMIPTTIAQFDLNRDDRQQHACTTDSTLPLTRSVSRPPTHPQVPIEGRRTVLSGEWFKNDTRAASTETRDDQQL